ncbi:MAG TPA: hypothetical protein VGC06_04515 [Actinomycetes bacterium]
MTVNIDHLRGRRYRPPISAVELARRVKHVIDVSGRAGMGFMITPGDALGNCRDVPGAERTFGLAVLEAAAEKLPPGACRWHLARALATRHGLPAPLDTPATRLLIGKPCASCLPAVQPAGREAVVAAAGGTPRDSYTPGTYEVAGVRGGRVTLGRRVLDHLAGARDRLDPAKHYLLVSSDGSQTVQHASACALRPDACALSAANLANGGGLAASAGSPAAPGAAPKVERQETGTYVMDGSCKWCRVRWTLAHVGMPMPVLTLGLLKRFGQPRCRWCIEELEASRAVRAGARQRAGLVASALAPDATPRALAAGQAVLAGAGWEPGRRAS